MASSNFIDYVKIYFTSGNGGSGSPHLLRERNNAKGGPDGGDGGRGGHIILRGNTQHWTLLPLKYRKHIKAQHGHPGGQNQRTGADGRDEIIDVPLGTIARNAETGEQICEVTSDGESVILLPGGKGGLGNVHFKRATHQTPRYSQPGIPGQEATIILELKILADVGLVGFPNAGKSTLLSVVSAAKPEIADYAFTTLVPNLGMVAYRNERSFVMADIPGIIEGASEGRGLGTRFLRHIERNAILLFLVPADAEDINAEYAILKNELEKYNPELMDKERIVAISKSDMLDAELKQEIAKTITFKEPWLYISSVSGDGIEALKDLIWNALQKVNE